jgi:hypothetical protein
MDHSMADRSQQQADEAAVASASHDQESAAVGGVHQFVGR